MITYLPSFAGATISDVLEAKRQIRTPLGAYKNAVKELEQRISADVLDPGAFEEEIDYLWHDVVEPQLGELTSAFQDTRLPRVSAAASGLVKGVLPPGLIFLVGSQAAARGVLTSDDVERIASLVESAGIEPLLTVDSFIGASVAGGVAGAVNGWREAAKSLNAIRNNNLFYLVDTSLSLSRRK